MQFDFLDWFYKSILYLVLAIGAILIAALVRSFYLRKQFHDMDDSDKLAAPSYEETDSGIKISIDDEDDP
ncbi:MAG: hypothetical protein KGD60_13880 [Candidatus Thorarchaeota archaeon]|nr:hypothetical protein [Candidatus Thorarchaeota archaeon]